MKIKSDRTPGVPVFSKKRPGLFDDKAARLLFMSPNMMI
jgi:hypothetical protein